MRRKLEDKSTRKISKRGDSYSVTLPIDLIRDLGWRERQRVVVKRIKGGLQIRDYRSK